MGNLRFLKTQMIFKDKDGNEENKKKQTKCAPSYGILINILNLFLFQDILRIHLLGTLEYRYQHPGTGFLILTTFFLAVLRIWIRDPDQGWEKIRIRDEHPR
jgi:hypothetical protein